MGVDLPFTTQQFLEVFRAYNDAIGVAPLLLALLAFVIVGLAHSTHSWRHRAIAVLLAALWGWSGIVYHWGFFATVNPAARVFGALFVVQAVVLIVMGTVLRQWEFDPGRSNPSIIGWLLVMFALFGYPMLGWVLGHGYPAGPSFGAPCPTTIFFLGMTAWISRGRLAVAAAIPIVWAAIGTSAAFSLGIYEDLALGVSALAVVATRAARRSPATERGTPSFPVAT